jgi:hypothetical protein
MSTGSSLCAACASPGANAELLAADGAVVTCRLKTAELELLPLALDTAGLSSDVAVSCSSPSSELKLSDRSRAKFGAAGLDPAAFKAACTLSESLGLAVRGSTERGDGSGFSVRAAATTLS